LNRLKLLVSSLAAAGSAREFGVDRAL